jgi:hypothetical protein
VSGPLVSPGATLLTQAVLDDERSSLHHHPDAEAVGHADAGRCGVPSVGCGDGRLVVLDVLSRERRGTGNIGSVDVTSVGTVHGVHTPLGHALGSSRCARAPLCHRPAYAPNGLPASGNTASRPG